MRLLRQPVQVAVAVAMTVLVEAVDEPSAVAVGFGALVAERKLQQMAHALRLARLVPHGVASLVPGGGHAVHLAQPEQAGRIVRHWLKAVRPASE